MDDFLKLLQSVPGPTVLIIIGVLLAASMIFEEYFGLKPRKESRKLMSLLGVALILAGIASALIPHSSFNNAKPKTPDSQEISNAANSTVSPQTSSKPQPPLTIKEGESHQSTGSNQETPPEKPPFNAPAPDSTETYSYSATIRKGTMFRDPRTGVILGIKYINPEYRMDANLTIPGKPLKNLKSVAAGESWDFRTPEGRFKLLVIKVDWISDTAELQVLQEKSAAR